MNYEPYNFESFKSLVQHAYNLGYYAGKKNLFTLRCDGKFEGFSGRASESWEQLFTLTSDEIKLENGKILPALDIRGKSIKEVCDKALQLLFT